MEFSTNALQIDPEKEVVQISEKLREIVSRRLKRRGLVVGISGGIDSSVTAALAVKALGPERVVGLQMPELHSSEDTLGLSQALADRFGFEAIHEDISGILAAVGFYRRYDDAIRLVIPDYGTDWKSKIVISNIFESKGFQVFHLVAQRPDGSQVKVRLPLKAYLEIVAATNFKQRSRKMLEYYHADRLNFAVAGTPNRLEYDQGFFVKLGDGAADVKPIAHLYKSQVYQLAAYLGVPNEICNRPPTTDTYSLAQGQDEFYFSLTHDRMDLVLYGKNNNVPIHEVASATGLTDEQVKSVYRDIETKRSTTRYLHLHPILIENVQEINLQD